MDDFFARVEGRWPAGRRDLHWHLLVDPAITERCLTRPYAELTRRQGSEPVAPRWLHTTVLHAGPVDQASEQELADITGRVRRACAELPPFDLTFDPPTVGVVAVECLARPAAPARRLWEITREATRAVVGDRWDLRPAVSFYPHASLAYATARVAAVERAQMKTWLSDHPGPQITLRMGALSLVAQWHDRRRIMWDHIATVPLAGE
ncbi:2'-5' RNA ligase family protein [Streptomyces buecherae]|uniref:2'-5' RNA ligase family protein n=1 Tax=Streptomyces buecherae TaxID=2763006 RepID=UPI0037928A44